MPHGCYNRATHGHAVDYTHSYTDHRGVSHALTKAWLGHLTDELVEILCERFLHNLPNDDPGQLEWHDSGQTFRNGRRVRHPWVDGMNG